MATQRYQTIIKDENQYYSKDCPISLTSYAILYDHKEKRYLAQLKLKNCSQDVIDSVRLTIRAFNQLGELSEEVSNCDYTDVNALGGSEFGAKALKQLSEKVSAKKLEVLVNHIVYINGQEWTSDDGELLGTVLNLELLSTTLSDEEIETYKSLINSKMQFMPIKCEPSWLCSCGVFNYNCNKCTSCGAEKEKVFEFITKEYLQNAIPKNKYEKALNSKKQNTILSLNQAIQLFDELGDYNDSRELADECRHELDLALKAQEEKKREEKRRAEVRKAEEEKKAKQKKNTQVIAVVAAIIAVIVGIVAIKVVIPSSKYNSAVALMEKKDYDAAIEAFEELNDYKNSADMITECENRKVYDEAEQCYDSGDYKEAMDLFNSLGDYRDSKQRAWDCYNISK